jgi:hypothetical protein
LADIYNRFPIIYQIFFLVNPDREIESSERYSLNIYVLLEGTTFDSDEGVKDKIGPLFEKLFKVERITVEVECGFLDDMTLFEFGFYKLWDREYLTLREEDLR